MTPTELGQADKPADNRPVLLVSGGPVTEPLWAPLAEHYDLAFLAPAAAQSALNQGLPAAALGSVMDGAAQERAGNDALKLAARVITALPQLAGKFADEYGPASPSALTVGLPDWFGGFAHQAIGVQVGIVAALERLAGMRRIAGCVTHEDVSADTRALVNWCNAQGIPTLHVPHAPCHLLPGVVDIHRETRARYIAASGPAVAAFYAEAGHDPADIAITGGPQWDGLYGARPGRDEARRVLKIDHAGPVLGYMTTWGQTTSLRSDFEREFSAGWDAVLATAQRLGAYLCVLVHWHDNRAGIEERYEKALADAGVPGLVTKHHKLYLLPALDCLVAQGPSNMAIEAAICGVPSCYLQTSGFDYATALPYRGTPETIGAAVDAALGEDPGWGEFVSAYHATHPHGGAVENVVAWVREICP
jgi:hypothetical protein